MTFSSAVMLWNSRMFWNVRAMPALTTLRGCGGNGCPSKNTEPAVGLYWPVRQLKNVVLPAPFGPMSPMISPDFTSMLTSLTAFRPPNCMVTFRASRRTEAAGEG